MKKVLILFGKSNWNKSRPFDNKKYMYSYEYFYELCKKNNIQMFRASYQWYDYRKNIFKHAWIFDKNSKARWRKVYDIKPNLVYDKTKSNPQAHYKIDMIRKKYSFFNHPQFTKLVDNKLYTSLLLPCWTKQSWFINSQADLEAAFKKIPGRKFVIKPNSESGGNNVFIGTKKEIFTSIKTEGINLKEYIVQEFIDSSKGIPKITKGVHDLRLVFVGKKLVYSYFRKPAEGALLANLAQGGTMEIVPNESLPKSLKPIISETNDVFSVFKSKIFTIDFMFDEKGKPWIVELNSKPGMYFAPGQEKTRKRFYAELLKTFRKELQKQ